MERREREQLQQERGRVRGRKKAHSVAHSNLDRERESEKGTKLSHFRNSSSSQPFAKRETLKDFFLNLGSKKFIDKDNNGFRLHHFWTEIEQNESVKSMT